MKFSNSILLSTFRRDEQGTIAVMFGLLAIPMVLFVGLAVDYSRALSADRDLQEAVDAAAIAAATYKINKKSGTSSTTSYDGTITQGDAKSAKQVALDYLNNNFRSGSVKNLARDAIEGDTSLTVSASADVQATFGALVIDKFHIQAKSAVKMSGTTAPLCMLGLNQSAPDTVKAWGTADLIAPNCAVVSNSTSSTGLNVGGNATMTGAAFCSAGGHSGTSFTPQPVDNCPKQVDPYAGKYTVTALANAGINLRAGCNENATVRPSNGTTYNVGASGVYVFCSGMNVKTGNTVNLGPGVFVFYNALTINSRATLKATQGTTIVFASKNWMTGVKEGVLDVIGGGNLQLVAPTTGPLASIAILQPEVSTYTGGATPANTHTMIGGGTIDIVGNWYTPQSKVKITGNGSGTTSAINSNSDYFSMVADFVDLEGNGQLIVKAGGDPSSVGMTAVPAQISVGGQISLME